MLFRSVSLQMLDRSRYDLAQLTHRRPIPYGLNDPTPRVLAANPFTALLLRLERSPVGSLDPDLPLLSLEMGRRKLAAQGLAFIVVHTDEYPAKQLATVRELLALLCGEPEVVEGAEIYRVGG